MLHAGTFQGIGVAQAALDLVFVRWKWPLARPARTEENKIARKNLMLWLRHHRKTNCIVFYEKMPRKDITDQKGAAMPTAEEFMAYLEKLGAAANMCFHHGQIKTGKRLLGAIKTLRDAVEAKAKSDADKKVAWDHFFQTEAYRYNEYLLKIRDLAEELRDLPQSEVPEIAVQQIVNILEIFKKMGLDDIPTPGKKLV